MATIRDGLVQLIQPDLGSLQLAGSFFTNDGAFGLDLVPIELGHRHSVGLELERQLPPVRGELEPEVGAVLAGFGIGEPPRDERELIDLTLGKPRGALE